MPFVLDASIVGNWFMPDEVRHPDAQAAWELIGADSALVPPHWWFEVRNLMLVAERKLRITEQYTASALHRLDRMEIAEAMRPRDHITLALARRHRLSFYDAAYLELALRESIALATLDDAVAAAAGVEGVDLIVGR
jgi:predicted nucleic acid-binding protein